LRPFTNRNPPLTQAQAIGGDHTPLTDLEPLPDQLQLHTVEEEVMEEVVDQEEVEVEVD
jgi:hypothetical protein